MAILKRQVFRVSIPIQSATGERIYEVEAFTEDEAKALVAAGDVRCADEEIHVTLDDDQAAWEVKSLGPVKK